MTLTINQKCLCLKSKKDHLKKGESYQVEYLYQLPDGDFMVSVIDKNNWTIRCYAKRFLLPFEAELKKPNVKLASESDMLDGM